MSEYKTVKTIILFALISCLSFSCQQKPNTENTLNIDSLVNVKVEAARIKLEEKARIEAEERVKQELQEQQKRKESMYPSGNSLKEREMRYYYAQGYDFGSHSTFSKADNEWMRKAFLLVVSKHDMSHASNKTLFEAFMAGVAQGRKELNDLQNQ